MITKDKKIMLWILWFLLWPLGLWLSTEFYYLNVDGQLLDIAIFGVFMCAVALFPLKINNKHIYFINGISIAVFLLFGLSIEIILSQLTIIVVLIQLGIKKKDSYRIPLNMLIFTVVSFAGAEVYFHLGGTHGAINYHNITEVLAVLGYAATIFTINYSLTKVIDLYFFKRKGKFFDKVFKWEFLSLLIILPIGFVLFLLYVEIGRIGIFYLGIPFIFISVILSLLYSYQELNRYLKQTGQIGHKLTKRINLAEVYDVFINEMIDLLPVDYAFIYSVKNENQLKLERHFDGGENIEVPAMNLKPNEKISGKVWLSGEPAVYTQAKDETKLRQAELPIKVSSVLSLPVKYDDITVGVITIASKQRNAFNKAQFKILDIITTYLGIATENAKYLEQTRTKGQKDGLTNLYNYHYFEEYLDNIDSNGIYSLLLLDLDHFKRINDTYGHEAGNEILTLVAARIKKCIGDKGIVARYGGEEFSILLFNKDTKRALKIGENLRKSIADEPFLVHNHLTDSGKINHVNVTVSIGVSTFPENCQDVKDLIRYADRAMYIGAKRNGRNKVAASEAI